MAKKKMTLEEKLEEAIVKDVPYEVPPNWINVSFGSIMSIEGGTQPPKSQFLFEPKEGYIRLYQIRDFSSENFHTYVKDEKKLRFMSDEDVMIARYGASIGKIFRGRKGAYNVALAKLIYPKELYDINYLYWFLKSDLFQNNLGNMSRTAVAGFNKNDLKSFIIPLPPLKEQQRIVDKIESLFGKLDNAKELIEEVRNDFEKRKSAILEKAFSGDLTKEWRKRNDAIRYGVEYLKDISEERIRIFKELLDESKKKKTKKPTKIHDIDMEYIEDTSSKTWIKTKLYNVLYDFRYGTSAKSDYTFLGMPVIRIPNLSNGYIIHEDMKYLQVEDVDINHKVSVGDLVIVRSNGSPLLVGKTSLITSREKDFAFASYLIRMRPCGIDSKYLYYVLNSIGVKEQFYSKSKSTSGINNINTEELGNSIIPLPPLDEQKEIVRILDKLLEAESKIEELTQLEEQIESIRKSILAKAFRGELGTNCEEDESALELLKEILSKQ
ncbi:restriction endonuclease subunit S [Clostridium baratii]|uniref:restriction endonuclease subunit S n=1 Tax=Clostridium baratii TaxID=1561 RepID=UPI0030D04CB9